MNCTSFELSFEPSNLVIFQRNFESLYNFLSSFRKYTYYMIVFFINFSCLNYIEKIFIFLKIFVYFYINAESPFKNDSNAV